MDSTNNHANSPRKKYAATNRRHQKIRVILVSGGVLLIFAAILLASFNKSSNLDVSPAKVGSVLKDFALTDIYGNEVHLSDYKGQPVLINAWATWCPPCKAEMPLLNDFYQAHKNDGFVLLAVNAGDSQRDAASFAFQNNLAFPVLLDPGNRLLNQMGVHSFPTSILIGRDGTIKTIHVGLFTPDSIENEITPLLTE